MDSQLDYYRHDTTAVQTFIAAVGEALGAGTTGGVARAASVKQGRLEVQPEQQEDQTVFDQV